MAYDVPIRAGASPVEANAIRKLAAIYERKNEVGFDVYKAAEQVKADVAHEYDRVMADKGFCKTSNAKGERVMVNDFDLGVAAKDDAGSAKLVRNLKDYEVALQAIDAYNCTRGDQRYWELATFKDAAAKILQPIEKNHAAGIGSKAAVIDRLLDEEKNKGERKNRSGRVDVSFDRER